MGVEVAGARDNSGHAGADTVPFNEGFMPHLYSGHVREGVQGPRGEDPRYHAEVPGAAPGVFRPGAEGQGEKRQDDENSAGAHGEAPNLPAAGRRRAPHR